MSAARHFFQRGTLSDDQLTTDIQSDISTSRQVQQELTSAGQYGAAARMSEAVDEHLDELNDVKRGSWRPKHA
jgi:hypothetical protein